MTENLSVPAPDDSGEFINYQTENGHTRIAEEGVEEAEERETQE